MFLLKHDIMDYSLYLTIEEVDVFKNDNGELPIDFYDMLNGRNLYISNDG